MNIKLIRIGLWLVFGGLMVVLLSRQIQRDQQVVSAHADPTPTILPWEQVSRTYYCTWMVFPDGEPDTGCVPGENRGKQMYRRQSDILSGLDDDGWLLENMDCTEDGVCQINIKRLNRQRFRY